MRERPILFSGPLVRAILEGRKTVTRRIVKGTALQWLDRYGFAPEFVADAENHLCPYGQPGDRLWVRETWGLHAYGDETDWNRESISGKSREDIEESWLTTYAADWGPCDEGSFWRPSIHMPRWASRITLEVTGVRVERLQDISEEDARAEGSPLYVVGHGPITDAELRAEPGCFSDRLYRNGFEDLWRTINGAESWDANPWVWVVEFKRVEEARHG